MSDQLIGVLAGLGISFVALLAVAVIAVIVMMRHPPLK